MALKKQFHYIRLIALAIFIGLSLSLSAQDCPPKSTGKLVNDFANVLSSGEEQQLTKKLNSFARETSNQIVIVTHPDFCGDAPYNFATEIGQNWGVGQKDLDNGVVIVFKPKTASSKGEVFISPGMGLEGAIPDATAKMIVDNEMIPHFKQKNTFKGLNAGADMVMKFAKGEINSQAYTENVGKRGRGKAIFAMFFMLAIFVLVFLVRAKRARSYARTNDLGFWAAFWLIGSSSGHGGYYNNFSSGSGGFGGGGGGFGGFGGGGFGGGGAGGSW
ncbi:TPM domain-containing protein [Halocola ammonii]